MKQSAVVYITFCCCSICLSAVRPSSLAHQISQHYDFKRTILRITTRHDGVDLRIRELHNGSFVGLVRLEKRNVDSVTVGHHGLKVCRHRELERRCGIKQIVANRVRHADRTDAWCQMNESHRRVL
jgi:hypothetical protein